MFTSRHCSCGWCCPINELANWCRRWNLHLERNFQVSTILIKSVIQVSRPVTSCGFEYSHFSLFSDEKKLVKLKYDWSTLQRKRNINKYTRLVSTLSLKQCSGSFPVLTLWKDGSVVVCTGQESCSHDYSFLIPVSRTNKMNNNPILFATKSF